MALTTSKEKTLPADEVRGLSKRQINRARHGAEVTR